MLFVELCSDNTFADDFPSYFESAQEKYSKTQKNIYILGDFDIDLLRCETCSYNESFLFLQQSWYLFLQ